MPTPRSKLADEIDQRLFRRPAQTAGERAERARRLSEAIGRSVELARGILAGRRDLTPPHVEALRTKPINGRPLLTNKAAEEIRSAEEGRDRKAPGRPLSRAAQRLAMARTETIAREHDDQHTADCVQALRLRVVPEDPASPNHPPTIEE